MHYFSNKFSKIAKRCGSPTLVPLNPSILVTWSCVIWPNWGFPTDNDVIELKKLFMTSLRWRYCYYVTEKPYQNYATRFFHFGPLPIKISGYASGRP